MNNWKETCQPKFHNKETCTQSQYLVEVVVQREAKAKKSVLPEKFWRDPEWKSRYQQQIVAANSLLKMYPFEAILKALNNKQLNWVYSLYQQKLRSQIAVEDSKMRKERKKLDEITKQAGYDIIDSTENKPRKTFKNKGKLGGLE